MSIKDSKVYAFRYDALLCAVRNMLDKIEDPNISDADLRDTLEGDIHEVFEEIGEEEGEDDDL